jgi:asparagine synthase (glutamine-hydrolysing)
VLLHLKEGDTLVVAERIVAVSEGRSFHITEIKPGFFARILSRFVYKHPGGIGLRHPAAMQLAIQEAGLVRIIFASIVSLITKVMGIRGVFYRVVGHNVNAIDGPSWYTLAPRNESVKLPPENPMDKLSEHFRIIHLVKEESRLLLQYCEKFHLGKLPL